MLQTNFQTEQLAKVLQEVPRDWFRIDRVYNPQTKKHKLHFVCEYRGCGATFLKSSNISNHFRKHDNRRPYICYICNLDFTQSGNLKKHFEKDHPQSAPKTTKKDFEDEQRASKKCLLGKRAAASGD